MANSMVEAMKKAETRRHEAAMDRLGAKLGRQMQGHATFFGAPAEENPVLKVANDVFQKSARRKLN
jgi:hypothetical protein